ncbi:MAG TPA: O-antigen ligase family protein [Candidatus Saccharimonadales bacterium]|nr:O-antigen ligase family protein [Candidatus Saccharimonadales bacterium]
MKPSTTVNKLALRLSLLVGLILVLLPFHAFLTVWLDSLVDHYTILRLWKEFFLAVIVAGVLYILAIDKPLRKGLLSFWPARLIGVYTLVLLIWGVIALAKHDDTGKAMWYGLLVDLRFLVFFLVVWVLATKTSWLKDKWQKFLFVPAIFVAAFAILQYLVLPYDFLKDFGYGPDTIFPYETINHNINHLRVMSTLRGANPLGAYLLLPISALAAMYFKKVGKKTDKLMFGFGLLLALVFSFSRSAWIGAGLSILIIVWYSLKSDKARKIMLLIIAGLIIVASLIAVALRNNITFENTFLHTEHASKVRVSSNEAHGTAFKNAARDIIHQPWGEGVGTAGPESIYNNHPARIAENYFLQVGQEAGVLGMALFISICAAVGKLLWGRRSDPLSLWLFASLVGITFINLLSHAWTDDTLAYIWWGLAGIALAPAILTDIKHKQHEKAQQTAP